MRVDQVIDMSVSAQRNARRLGTGAGILGSGAVVLLIAAAFSASHRACTNIITGDRQYQGWEFNPGAWFAGPKVTGGEICEDETGVQFVVGKIPLLGEGLEPAIGGPDDPAGFRRAN